TDLAPAAIGDLTVYEIDQALDDVSGTFSGRLVVRYTNRTGAPLAVIPILLHANAAAPDKPAPLTVTEVAEIERRSGTPPAPPARIGDLPVNETDQPLADVSGTFPGRLVGRYTNRTGAPPAVIPTLLHANPAAPDRPAPPTVTGVAEIERRSGTPPARPARPA